MKLAGIQEQSEPKLSNLKLAVRLKNIRDLYKGICNFKKVYQPRTNITKGEKVDLVADFHSIVARWRNHFSQPLNTHGDNDVRQRKLHIAQLLVPEPSVFEFELAFGNLKGHKSPCIDQIPAELIKTGGRTICPDLHKLIISAWSKKKLLDGWKKLIIVLIYKKGNESNYSNYWGMSPLLVTCKLFLTSCRLSEFHMQRKLLRIINGDCDAADQLPII
jgi:hypothetical protein